MFVIYKLENNKQTTILGNYLMIKGLQSVSYVLQDAGWSRMKDRAGWLLPVEIHGGTNDWKDKNPSTRCHATEDITFSAIRCLTGMVDRTLSADIMMVLSAACWWCISSQSNSLLHAAQGRPVITVVFLVVQSSMRAGKLLPLELSVKIRTVSVMQQLIIRYHYNFHNNK